MKLLATFKSKWEKVGESGKIESHFITFVFTIN
jgi:hypothetical protein